MKALGLLLVVVVTTISSFANEELIQPSVIGGSDTIAGEHPWVVALIREENESIADGQFCGGTLIHPQWVLSAAHCVEDLLQMNFYIAVGESDLSNNPRLIAPNAIVIHPSHYHRTSRGIDLALIRLSESVTDIPIAPLTESSSIVHRANSARIVGWGDTTENHEEQINPHILQVADIPLIDLESPENTLPTHRWAPHIIAAGEKNNALAIGSGDSGSPLLIRSEDDSSWIAAGVASFTSGNTIDGYYASIFADIGASSNWIHSYIRNGLEGPKDPKPEFKITLNAYNEPQLTIATWPFSENYSYDVYDFQLSGQNYAPTRIQLKLSDSDQFTMNKDGRVNIHIPFQSNQTPPYTKHKLSRIEINSKDPDGSGLLALYPNQSFNGIATFDQHSLFKNCIFFDLKNFQPGFEYLMRFVGDRTPLGTTIYEVSDDSLKRVDSAPFRNPITFKPEADKTYWLMLKNRNYNPLPFQFHPQVLNHTVFELDTKIAATLSKESHPYRLDGFKADFYTYTSLKPQEIALQVFSEFDSEIAINDRLNGNQIAYYDQDGENATERLIMSGRDLYQNEIRIFNFDPYIYGDYTIQILTHSDDDLSYDTPQQRALTEYDEYFNNDGPQTYESLLIPESDLFQSITIKVNGYYEYNPTFAVFEKDAGLIDSAYDDSFAELSFSPEIDKEYRIIIADFNEPRNSNYKITLTGVER